jgi:putative membrane protein
MTALTRRIREILPASDPTERLGYGLLAIWLLTMISLPIAYWIVGDVSLPVGITLAAIVQATAVFYMVQHYWSMTQALRALAIVAVVTWAAEFVGHSTGLPFGAYHYTDVLQPQLLGVPLLIPLAWFMLLPPVWALAQIIIPQRDTIAQKLTFVAVSAAGLTAWDLFLDPQMVGWNFWVWENPGLYFGIPLINYGGWLLVSGLVTLLVNPPELPPLPLVLVYAAVWFLQSVGQAVFWGQPGPALFGSLGMGGFMLIAWWRYQSAHPPQIDNP